MQSDDPVGDIKKHVSAEVKSGVETVKKSLRDEHEKLTQRLTNSIQNEIGDVLAGVKDHLKAGGQKLISDVAGGRPIIPAVLSGVTLAFTEARDFFSWKEAATTTATQGSSIAATPATVPAAPDAVQAVAPSSADQTVAAPDTASQVFAYLHNIAASIPNEWIFRLRIGAAVLIAYAIYKLWQRRAAAAKAQRGGAS